MMAPIARPSAVLPVFPRTNPNEFFCVNNNPIFVVFNYPICLVINAALDFKDTN